MGTGDWRVLVHRRARRVIERLGRDDKRRVGEMLDALAHNPRPRGAIPLEGQHDLYRARVGNWRIVYQIRRDELLVLVVRIRPRGDVYKRG